MFLNEEVHSIVIDEGFSCIERVCNTSQTPSLASSPHEIHAPLTAPGGQYMLQTFLAELHVSANIFLKFFQRWFSAVTVKIYASLLFGVM